MNLKILIFALAASGKGVSGGDRIFIEFARRWSLEQPVKIIVWEEGQAMCERLRLREHSGLKIKLYKMAFWAKGGMLICYIARIIASIFYSIKLCFNFKRQIIYSASEFWMDSIPAIILKIWHPETFWVAAWYQTAPNPFKGLSEGKREKFYRLRSLVYWLVQMPVKPFINKYADLILVNNEEERKQFKNKDKLGKVSVVLGAVNLDEIQEYASKFNTLKKKYEGVFQGRFHPQKGVVELIEIWAKVVNKKKDAKLAMIGDGPLMNDVKEKIKDLNLEENVQLFGYLFDGPEKYSVFSLSKVVVHPSFFDSGGMAAAEAMAFGLPAVAFNLKSYESYYPKGVLKVPIGNLEKFADSILLMLDDKEIYLKYQRQAIDLIKTKWDWNVRAKEILSKIRTLIK